MLVSSSFSTGHSNGNLETGSREQMNLLAGDRYQFIKSIRTDHSAKSPVNLWRGRKFADRGKTNSNIHWD
jgi:hypothetical protein